MVLSYDLTHFSKFWAVLEVGLLEKGCHFLGRLLMVGTVAANEVGALYLAEVGKILGGRHAGEMAELLVEVGVIGEAKVIDDGGKHTLIERLHHLCGMEKALGANHLLGRHSHVLGEDAAKLALAEACDVAKPVDAYGGVAVDGAARCHERLEVHAVAAVVEASHYERLNYGDGFIIG